jgi:hypothetical protein
MIITFSAYKEPKISLPCARKLNLGPYPDPIECGSKLHTLISKGHFNIILSSRCTCPKWSISLRILSLYIFCMVSGNCRDVDEVFPFGSLAPNVCSYLRTFMGQPLGPIFNGQADQDPRPSKIGVIVFPETSVNNYQHALRNNAEDLTHIS